MHCVEEFQLNKMSVNGVGFKSKIFSPFFKFAKSKSNRSSPADVTEVCEGGCQTDLKEISKKCLFQALLIVRYFYDDLFRNSIDNDETEHPKLGEEPSDYIKRMCDDVRWFGRPNIFERCLASIVITCSEYSKEVFSDIKKCAHVSWSKYFDEYSKEFYNEGGWKKLRRIAHSYAKVDEFILIQQDSLDFIKLSKSVENYMYFCLIREFISEDKNKSKVIEGIKIEYGNKFKTCASLWIKFIVQNGNTDSQEIPPSQPRNDNSERFDVYCTPPPKSIPEVTCLLRALRMFCDPYGFKADHSELLSNPGLPQKSNHPADCPSGNIQESCTRKENYRKGEPNVSLENSNFNDITVQECSNSTIQNVAQQNIAVAKECEDKEINIENFTGGEKDRTDNVLCTLSPAHEDWTTVTSKKGKKNVSQGFIKSLELVNTTAQESLNSGISKVPQQNPSVGKGGKDNGKKNFTGGKNDKPNNLPSSSSTASKKRKKNKRKKDQEKPVSDDNSGLDEATGQQSSSSISNNVPLQNTEGEKESDKVNGENVAEGENDRMGQKSKNCLIN